MRPEDFCSIISSAIDGEIEAYNFYKNVSEKVQDSALKMYTQLPRASSDSDEGQTFLELAKMEKTIKRGLKTSTPAWLFPKSGSAASRARLCLGCNSDSVFIDDSGSAFLGGFRRI